jgi:hypothetical protein
LPRSLPQIARRAFPEQRFYFLGKRPCRAESDVIEVDGTMAGSRESKHRKRLSVSEIERAQRVLHLSWLSLPAAHRALLESVGASQSQAVDQPLGTAVDSFLRSAGHRGLSAATRCKLDLALGVWLQELRIIIIDVGHSKLVGLDRATYEAFIVRTAWHEWGHALSVVRCSQDDVAAGRKLLGLAPAGIREGIRQAGYRPSDYTHELVAETYALLLARRQREATGRPSWLDSEIYNLVKRVTGWSE